MRTTLDIDQPVLSEVKSLGKREGRSLGRVVSDLLAVGLAQKNRATTPSRQRMRWVAKPMGARVDLADRDALYDAMDADKP